MSVYNGERYLNEAVDSILGQTFTDFEFLIIDDASTDRTPEILRSYDDPRIRVVNNEENLGLTKSLNKGLALAKGEYIARMDADDVSLPKRLEKEMAFLESNATAVLVGTARQTIDHQNRILGIYIPPIRPQYRDLIKYNSITHGSVVIRKEILEKFSGYNELFRKCQDYALWLQMSQKYHLFNIPDVLYKLRVHENSVSRTGEESIYYHILAIRAAEGIISQALIDEIRTAGVKCLRSYFTDSEWIFYHSSMANRYRYSNDLNRARQEYLEIFRIKPFDILNCINIVRVSLGKEILEVTSRVYTTLINKWNYRC